MQDPSDATLRLRWTEKSEIQVAGMQCLNYTVCNAQFAYQFGIPFFALFFVSLFVIFVMKWHYVVIVFTFAHRFFVFNSNSAGMVAFYILTNGKHPFGAKIKQLENMRIDNPVGLQTYGKLIDPVVKDLLSQMLAQKQDKRPYVEQALKHPYFLSAEEQIKFLEAVGNGPEIKNTKRHHNCAVSQNLDKYPSKPDSLLPLDWIAVIHPDDFKTFCSSSGGRKPFNYDGGKYTQCLRLIRNVRQHWVDTPRSPLKGMGKATSLDDYFLQLFPKLPLVLHQITREHPDWKIRANLKEFFPVINRRAMSEEDTDAD